MTNNFSPQVIESKIFRNTFKIANKKGLILQNCTFSGDPYGIIALNSSFEIRDCFFPSYVKIPIILLGKSSIKISGKTTIASRLPILRSIQSQFIDNWDAYTIPYSKEKRLISKFYISSRSI